MTIFTRGFVAVLLVAGMVLSALSAAAGAATSEGAAETGGGDVLAAQVAAYQRAYPGLSQEQARKAALGQEDRKAIYEEAAKGGGKEFGGAWFDPREGVLHVAATTPAAAKRAEAAGKAKGVTVKAVAVKRNINQLERQAKAIREGKDELAQAARGQVGLDVTTNTVVVSVPAERRAELEAKGVPDGVVLVDDLNIQTEADACASRAGCDTLRAGLYIWRGSAGNNVCSLGFTGRDQYNRRYMLTSGHCSNGNNVTWGQGSRSVGYMYASANSGTLDAAIIPVTNSYFANHAGGELYLQGAADNSGAVQGVAPSVSYIWQGDTVCLAANIVNATGGNRCGVIGTNSDSAVRGMARVDGVDACPGDSGGGWYWLTSSSRRIAFGLHSRSDTGCNGDQGGNRSWFTPMPTVKDWAPWLTIETR
jgi:streptogrisin C